MVVRLRFSFFFFFNDTATTEIYTLSLHDALPILHRDHVGHSTSARRSTTLRWQQPYDHQRSEEHTSELQSHVNIVCRLLLEKKKSDRSASAGWPAAAQKRTHPPTPPSKPSGPSKA